MKSSVGTVAMAFWCLFCLVVPTNASAHGGGSTTSTSLSGRSAQATARGEAASACSAETVNAGRYGGEQTLRFVLIGSASCSKARRLVHAYYSKMAAGGCGRLNNFCNLQFSGGWDCSLFFATESEETGGAIAGCARTGAKIRLYRVNSRTPTQKPANPPEFFARPVGGFITCGFAEGERMVCWGGPLTPDESDPLEHVATLQSDGQVEPCSRQRTEVRCFEGNVGENTPTLSAGTVDTIGPFNCKVLATGVECTVTATGIGFLITPSEITKVGG
jgi:hypothetical protein